MKTLLLENRSVICFEMLYKILKTAFILMSFICLVYSSAKFQSKQLRNNAEVSPTQPGKIEFKGVSFNYNSRVFNEIKPEEVSESPLQNETDKPDGVYPQHILFTLNIPNQRAAIIKIFSIEDYRRVWKAAEKNNAKYFDIDLADLRKVIKDTAFRRDGEIPYIPFIDASQSITAKLKNLPFKDGSGFVFLTQYDFEMNFINNEGLEYIFQGISNDGKYYVLGNFPSQVSFLPKDYQSEFEGRNISSFYKEGNQSSEEYDNYLKRIGERLEKLPPEEFQPNLKYFEEIISSLKIEK